MDVGRPTHRFASSVAFSFYRPDQIERISVKRIHNPVIFDQLNRPTDGGLYDLALGPLENSSRCITCACVGFDCLGHFGHIDLNVPAFNPVNFGTMMCVLKCMCTYCHRFMRSAVDKRVLVVKLVLLNRGLAKEAFELDSVVSNASETSTADAFLLKEDEEESAEDDSEAEEENSFFATDKKPGKKAPKVADAVVFRAIDAYVAECISNVAAEENVVERVGNNTIHQERLALIRDFLSPKTGRRCAMCSGINPRIKSLENTKVFEYPLSAKHQSQMRMKGLEQNTLLKDILAERLHDLGIKKLQPEDATEEAEENENDNEEVSKEELSRGNLKLLTGLKVQQLFKSLWKHEQEILDLLFNANGATSDSSMFFLTKIAVPPSKFRPLNVLGEQTFEHPQNIYLTEILKANLRLETLQSQQPPAANSLKQTVETWILLQQQIQFFFDSSKNMAGPMGKNAPAGIKQILEKKEGLFRKHMMGKRVNFAARTVISPDPNIATNEIGIPIVFAKKLTYPETVTAFNFHVLRQNVINGADAYPGATHVQKEDGTLVALHAMPSEARVALANSLMAGSDADAAPKRVFRNLRNGDVLLLNRQPTLHKPSIMAHKCRVLAHEKVLRMHYANCDTYNADFDGDEMNVHFPQNELARAEAYEIAATDHQYLVPTDGEPLRGLIQDHIGTAVWLTKRDTFLDAATYQQLLYGTFEEAGRRLLLLPPAVTRPRRLWTGKQLVSTLLLNLVAAWTANEATTTAADLHGVTFTAKCKIPARLWPTPEDALVTFRGGHMLTGVLDKSQLGASAFGLVHAVQELYGGAAANGFLSAMGRLLTKYLQNVGFTCRLDDLMLSPAADAERSDLIARSRDVGCEVAAAFAKISEADLRADARVKHAVFERILRSEEAMRGLDGAMKRAMNKLSSKIIDVCLPSGVRIAFPHNHMALMTNSGAKGSNVNFSQISGLLAQQELEGRRVPTMISGKTLPSFAAFDTRARAGGYITGRFLTGIPPQEFYFHCMAGREGLIDTAVKTSRSGYLQRCLMKHLESLRIAYDCTVRNADSSVVQFFYGEDGLDVMKQKYMRNMEFVAANFHRYLAKYRPADVLERIDAESAVAAAATPSSTSTLMANFAPTKHLGAVSEAFATALETFIGAHADSLLSGKRRKGGIEGVTRTRFRALMWLKYMHSLAEPGESVGVLAAQSIGEPSTQMTLNTFHLAGFGAKNVTLGIPRLREIVMTAARKPTTPTMTLPLLRSDISGADLQLLCNTISRATLQTILQHVRITEQLTAKMPSAKHATRTRDYHISLQLLAGAACESTYNVHAADIRRCIDGQFLKLFMSDVMRALKKRAKKTDADASQSGDDDGVISAAPVARLHEADAMAATAAASLLSDESFEAGAFDVTKAAVQEDSSGKESDSDSSSTESDSDLESNETLDAEVLHESTAAHDEATTAASSKAAASDAYSHPFLKSWSFDETAARIEVVVSLPAAAPKLLMLDVVEGVAPKAVLHHIKGINKCYAAEDGDNAATTAIVTEGSNIRGVWPFDAWIDVHRIYTNDIWAALTTYGVEAARALITKEIAAVFDVYGISVDFRHLSLIADTMTFEGGFKPFNRSGMDSVDAPFLQMSFETTMTFMRSAATFGARDTLQSPSSRLVMGVPTRVGTGSFDVLHAFSNVAAPS